MDVGYDFSCKVFLLGEKDLLSFLPDPLERTITNEENIPKNNNFSESQANDHNRRAEKIHLNMAFKLIYLNGHRIKVLVWDMPKSNLEIASDYYRRGCNGALLVFDVHDRCTYNKMKQRLKKLRESNANIPVVVIGNTSQNTYSEGLVTVDEAMTFCKENHILSFFEFDALDGIPNNGFDEAFKKILSEMFKPILVHEEKCQSRGSKTMVFLEKCITWLRSRFD